jgi:hypothetical protein
MKTDEATKEIQLPDQETRREFLIKAGKVAIYTPPAVMLLMHPSKDALAQSGGGGGIRGHRRRRRRHRRPNR